MAFTDINFILLFLPLVLAVFFLLGRFAGAGAAALWLALASLVFYGWNDPQMLLPVIIASIAFNYLAGRLLALTRSKSLLSMAVAVNLIYLGVFKYANFFVGNFAHLTGIDAPKLAIILPIGISFFTFTQIAFLVDVYQGKAREYKLSHYLLFVTFFPHLVAGPILHHKEMMPQFERKETYRFNALYFAQGLAWFAAGIFKKRVLADNLGDYVNIIFPVLGAKTYISFVDAWTTALAYTFQLYFDFSGYSDMAIGLALMMGIWLPLNFNSPYRATSIIEFWRRWHMTLSRFLRDYLYIPLGGNRKGEGRRYFNIAVTMLLGGLWHGAAWNFVVWGAMHGIGLCVNHLWQRVGLRMPKFMGWLLTFLLVVLAFVPFRAATMRDAIHLWRAMFHLSVPAWYNLLGSSSSLWLLAAAFIAFFLPNTQQMLSYPGIAASRIHWRLSWAAAIITGAALGIAIGMLLAGGNSQFLYFQF